MTINIDQEHYTIKQLTLMWRLSYNTIKRMFQSEPGVLKMRAAPPVKGHRRNYTSWRIPRDVAERVYRRSQGQGEG